MTTTGYLGWTLASYLIGTISWSYLLVRSMKGIDLRSLGSGNLGATNAGRVLGKKWAIIIYFLDLAKGLGAVIPARMMAGSEEIMAGFPLALSAGLAVIAGHIFPFWLGFRGGKGVATGSGVVFALAPWTGCAAMVTWAILLLISRMVSLSSILAALALPAVHHLFEPGAEVAVTWFLVGVAILVVVTHRSNIARILAGTEHKTGQKKT